MATRDVTCVRGPPAAVRAVRVCVRVLCCAVLCYAIDVPCGVRGLPFPAVVRADAVYRHVIELDPALPPIGPSRRYKNVSL